MNREVLVLKERRINFQSPEPDGQRAPRGLIVDIKPAGRGWGRREDPDQLGRSFYIITVVGMPARRDPLVRPYFQSIRDGSGRAIRRAMRRLSLSMLPGPKRIELQNTNRTTISWETFQLITVDLG